MPIQIIADALTELPEALRSVAKQDGNKFRVDALPDGFAVDNTAGLRKTVSDERAARKLLAEKLRAFGWTLAEDGSKWTLEGLDATDAASALEKVKSGTLKTPKEMEDFKASLIATADAKEKALAAEREAYRVQLEDLLITQGATAAFAKAGGAKALSVLLPLAKSMSRVEKGADGKLRAVLYDEAGKPRLSARAGANGAPMSYEELAEECRGSAGLKPLFEVQATGGSGGASQSGGSARAVGADLTNLSGDALLTMANTKA